MKFRKKPIVIEATKIDITSHPKGNLSVECHKADSAFIVLSIEMVHGQNAFICRSALYTPTPQFLDGLGTPICNESAGVCILFRYGRMSVNPDSGAHQTWMGDVIIALLLSHIILILKIPFAGLSYPLFSVFRIVDLVVSMHVFWMCSLPILFIQPSFLAMHDLCIMRNLNLRIS